MWFKILSLSAVTLLAVHLGRRHRSKNNRLQIKKPPSKFIHREKSTVVTESLPSTKPREDWFRFALLLLLSTCFLLGIAAFSDSLPTNENFFRVSILGALLLLSIVIILTRDIFSGEQKKPTESVSCCLETINLNGDWIKNPAESTSADEVFEIMKIGPLIRTAVRLVKGIRIKQTTQSFHLTVFSVVEVYSMSGETSQWKRRDLRRGLHSGYVDCQPGSNCLRLHLKWEAPFAGKGFDEFVLLSEDKLLVRSTLYASGQTASYDTVYNRNQKS